MLYQAKALRFVRRHCHASAPTVWLGMPAALLPEVCACFQCTLGANISASLVIQELNYRPVVLLVLGVLRTVHSWENTISNKNSQKPKFVQYGRIYILCNAMCLRLL